MNLIIHLLLVSVDITLRVILNIVGASSYLGYSDRAIF